MDSMGIREGTRICFIDASIIALIVFVVRYYYIKETLASKPKLETNVVRDISEVFPLIKGTLRGMLVASIITQFAANLTSAYIVIYAVDIIGLTKTEWGIITTIMSTLSLLTAIPGGMISDRFDKRKLLAFSRAIEPATNIGYITFRNIWQIISVRVVAGAAMGISGANVEGMLGGPAWSSSMADLVSPRNRGRVSGLMGTFSGLAAFCAPYLGAFAWESPSIGPDISLVMSSVIGVSSSFVIWFFVRDPRFETKATTSDPNSS